jgi:hypothetical protein
MTSPLSRVLAICPEKEVDLIQNLLHTLDLSLTLAQAARATTTIMLAKMTAGQIYPSSTGIPTPLRVTMADTFIALIRAIPFLPLSLPQV